LMNTYCAEVRKLEAHFEALEFHHVFAATTTWQSTSSPS
jgi:hypothetical protein